MPSDELANAEKTRRLADGKLIPLIGLGTWQIPNGDECTETVRAALELGYRHIDTAQAYGTEVSVGRGLRASGVERAETFLTTKFYPGRTDPVAEIERSLERLQVDYVDLYLIHWPQGGPTWAWPAMERAQELGYARSIGISNFGARELEQLVPVVATPPAVNQVQFSPYEYRIGLRNACQRHDVVLEAYSPLGHGRHLSSNSVTQIAERLGHTPAQILLRWCVQHQTPFIAKSTHLERMAENAQLFDFVLSDQDMQQLDALDQTNGTDLALENSWW
jgi:diketogulonate reductase-like aldo/keto reductase